MRNRGFEICKGYEDKNINLPIRKTKSSVGYDFEAAEDIIVPSIWKSIFSNMANFLKGTGEEQNSIKPALIKTGVKAYFQEDEVFILANKSSNPFKKGLVLANSIGIIESDYYGNEDNDGHLMFAFYNFFPTDITIKKGDSIGQGYFQKFLVTDDDKAQGIRTGGFGSTSKENEGK